MNKRAGSLALVFGFFIFIGVSGQVLATESLEPPVQALPQACFDTANTAEPCQILYRYAELFGFANIPDYVGFVESAIAEARGDAPYLPLLENPEIKRFLAVRDSEEPAPAAMIEELKQFMSHYFQVVADFRHAQDPISLRMQDFFFSDLIGLNAQLFPELEKFAAIEATFLHANPRLPYVLQELSPIADGEGILTEGNEPHEVLIWLTSLYELSDEHATQALLLQLVNQYRYGGSPFDLPLFDQRPGIGPLLNMPVDIPILISEVLRDDIDLLRKASSTKTNHALQNIHLLSGPLRVNNLLSLLSFAEGMTDPQPRIPYAQSRSVVDLHIYIEEAPFAQIRNQSDVRTSIDADVVATIMALRSGAKLPVVGSTLVQLEDANSGSYVVIALTPLMGRVIYTHTAGYETKERADEAD